VSGCCGGVAAAVSDLGSRVAGAGFLVGFMDAASCKGCIRATVGVSARQLKNPIFFMVFENLSTGEME
jgi:hypothetical protein